MSTNRQRFAFEYLRKEARESHLSGDGLRVNHLAAMGLAVFSENAKNKCLSIGLADIKWACILPLYWLVHSYLLNASEHARKAAGQLDSVSDSLDLALRMYAWHIEQPLGGINSHFIEKFDFQWCKKDDIVEDSALITHMSELLWWRSHGQSQWLVILEAWLTGCPEWLRSHIDTTRQRLMLQERFTRPSKDILRVSISDKSIDSSGFVHGKLWTLLLNRDSAALDNEVQNWIRQGLARSTDARLVFDVHHWNRFTGLYGDSQPIGLTRRLLQTVDSPTLLFNEMRQAECDDLLYKLYRDETESNASSRFDVFRCVMLTEIGALRMWSWGDWADAARKEADACFEVCRWEDNPEWVYRGLLLKVWAGGMPRANDRRYIRRALLRLEFAPGAPFQEFVESLLNVYLQQKRAVWDLLLDIGDLLPSDLWNNIANWQVQYLSEVRTKKVLGPGIETLALWTDLLPYVPKASPIWDILRVEALGMAAAPWTWQYGLYECWMKHAPLPLALELGDKMLGFAGADERDTVRRAVCLCNAELSRPELCGRYREKVISTITDWKDKLLFINLLSIEQQRELAANAKPFVLAEIRTMIKNAVPPEGAKTWHPPSGRPSGIQDVMWAKDDLAVLGEIITTINNVGVLAAYLPPLLASAHDLTLVGPVEFAELIIPYLNKWLLRSPRGRRSSLAQDAGPFGAGLHLIEGVWSADLCVELSWLISALLSKVGDRAGNATSAWFKLLSKHPPAKAAARATMLALRYATVLPKDISRRCVSDARDFLMSASSDIESSSQPLSSQSEVLDAVIDCLRELPATTACPDEWQPFVETLTELLPELSKSSEQEIRLSSTILARMLVDRSVAKDALSPLLDILAKDNRASIRHAARGIMPH